MSGKPQLIARTIALTLCAALATSGCAATAMGAASRGSRSRTDPAVLADYIQRLPAGSAIRVERVSGSTLRGTLMKATDRSVIVQPRTRLPEPAVELSLDEVLSVTPDVSNGSNLGRAIGVGAAAGAGAALTVFVILIAAFSD